MFAKGETIIYSSTGVCRIDDIVDGSRLGCEAGREYYIIKPVHDECTIQIPVDSPVYMRTLIDSSEAEALLESLAGRNPEPYFARSVQQLGNHYDEVLKTHDCSQILDMILSIYAKRRFVESKKQKFGQLDERFMKRAELLLFTELSETLGVTYEDIADRIKSSDTSDS